MAQAASPQAEDKSRAGEAPGQTTTEWRRRSLLRVRRPAWAGHAATEAAREPSTSRGLAS